MDTALGRKLWIIVGAGIQNAPGYASRMFGALADAGVNIEIISTSEIRITCIIADNQLATAVKALHKAFAFEGPEQPLDGDLTTEAGQLARAAATPVSVGPAKGQA